MTDLNFKKEVNYSDLKNTKFFEVKAYSLDDESKYITLKVQNVTDKLDDKGNYIGDEFTVRFVELGLLTNFFISSQLTFFMFPGTEHYGFKINRDK